MSLSKNHSKLITSLQQKKYRNQHKLFVVEGIKGVKEFLDSTFVLHSIYVEKGFSLHVEGEIEISNTELKKISSLKSPNKVLAVFEIPEFKDFNREGFILVLDSISDPGNLGTIIRLCDWFGVETLLCSIDTVDCFNSKVVQATMGSLTRVNIIYKDLKTELENSNLPVFIADMNGGNVYQTELPKKGILVMGNEANGISESIKEMANYVLSIPRFGNSQKTESLNVATATSILLSEFRRS